MIRRNHLVKISAWMVAFCCTLMQYCCNTVSAAGNTTVVPEGYTAIYTIDDLYAVRNNLSANYILMADIDMSKATAKGGIFDTGNGWEPIGSSQKESFSGVFDGNGHTLSGMQIFDASGYVGLFGYVSGGTIKNLGLENISVEAVAARTLTNGRCGGIVGHVYHGEISGCYTTGKISAVVSSSYDGRWDIGGIAGVAEYSVLRDCYSFVSVYGEGSSRYYQGNTYEQYTNVSGICGALGSGAECSTCITIGNVTAGNEYALTNAICAIRRGTSGEFSDCYYNKGGGVCNYSDAQELSGTQLKNASMLGKLDFETVWYIDTYSGILHPQLYSNPENAAVSVVWSSKPSKLTYIERQENIDVTNGKIKMEYEDGTVAEIPLSADMISGFNNAIAGTQKLTVQYGGQVLHYQIEVKHDYATTVIAPTCTVNGYTLHTCRHCGNSYTDTPTNATGHTLTQTVSANQYLKSSATCTLKAEYYYSCSCGEKGDSTFVHGSPLGHKYGEYQSNAEKHWKQCACGSITEEASHTPSEWVVDVEATLKATGKKHRICTVCSFLTDEGIIEKKTCGHAETYFSGKVEATCSIAGYSGDTVCKICDDFVDEGEVIPVLQHKWDSGIENEDSSHNKVIVFTCKLCGETILESTQKSTSSVPDVPHTTAEDKESSAAVSSAHRTENNSEQESTASSNSINTLLLGGIFVLFCVIAVALVLNLLKRNGKEK